VIRKLSPAYRADECSERRAVVGGIGGISIGGGKLAEFPNPFQEGRFLQLALAGHLLQGEVVEDVPARGSWMTRAIDRWRRGSAS
jgi:hypothetical protein